MCPFILTENDCQSIFHLLSFRQRLISLVTIMSQHFPSHFDQNNFRIRVWEIVRQIPSGHVATYGQIAGMIPPPPGVSPQGYRAFGARWVGAAMAACPEGVPWHRVINAQGKISLRGGSENLQKELLESEGVTFNEQNKIDLKKFSWVGTTKS